MLRGQMRKFFLAGIGFSMVSLAFGACGGSDSVTPPNGASNKDSASAVVGPAGGRVVVPSGAAGVEIPPNSLSQTVTVTVSLLQTPATPGAGPLPTPLKQYPPYYEFVTSPAGVDLGPGVRVGVCQVTDASNKYYPPESTHPRLRLAHTVGAGIELLDPVDVSDFLRCSGVTAEAPQSRARLGRFAAHAARALDGLFNAFGPSSAYAAHGGLGGKVKSFSPFGAVDPGPLNVATTFPVSSRSTFLLTDTVDSAADAPLVIELGRLGFVPGDVVKLERLGEFKPSTILPESDVAMIAVFSSTNEFRDRLSRVRVPGAISGGLSVGSPPTLFEKLDTDIPEDFSVTTLSLTIPTGALYLFVGVNDSHYSDNTDTDNNFAIQITPPGFAGIRSTVAPSIQARGVR
jgi:hypothetical protein